jgi:hypothetical protein
MPAFGRSRPADAALAVQGASALEYPSDGANGGEMIAGEAARKLAEFTMDSRGSVFAERRFVVQSFAGAQDEVFNPLRRAASSAMPAAWPIGPIDAVQAMPLCPSDPFLDSSQTHAELLSNNSWRLSTTDSRRHLTPP